MDREQILEQSRKENKEQDLYEQEVLLKGSSYGAITGAIIATLFFIVQILAGGGRNHGLYAVIFSIAATSFIYKAIKLKRKHEIFVASIYTLMTILASWGHILDLIAIS